MEDVFTAVADPTRRSILESLRRSEPLSLGEIAQPFTISRQAVTKHLDALAAAGLIRIERRGRERLHRLEAEPLRQVAEWLEPYERLWDERLERLKQFAEREEKRR